MLLEMRKIFERLTSEDALRVAETLKQLSFDLPLLGNERNSKKCLIREE
jgi:hypothetical protein